jgi:D-cysteine desulfhydrase
LKQPARFPLAVLPTPLVHAPRLSTELGRDVWIKRDDLAGFAFGGNKVRPLEVLIADAVDRRCDHIVGCGGPSSNLCVAFAGAAATAGLSCTIVLYGCPPRSPHPHLAMMRALGALVFTGDPDRGPTPRHAEIEAARLGDGGRRPYVVPRVQLALRTEGILADVTYVARAVAALRSLRGPLVLWHTGGVLGFVGDATIAAGEQ